MYVRPEQLRQNLESLDSAQLQAKLLSGQLTSEARALTLDILAARGVAVDAASVPPTSVALTQGPHSPPNPWPGRGVAKVVLALYGTLVVICSAIVFLDPPWVAPRPGTWEGMIGMLASEASGAPWSVWLLLNLSKDMTPGQVVAMNFACAALNVGLLLAYIRHARPAEGGGGLSRRRPPSSPRRR